MKRRVQIIKADGTVGYITLRAGVESDCSDCQSHQDVRVSKHCKRHSNVILRGLAGIWLQLRKWFDPSYQDSEIS